jgi:hypothetical protein
MQVVLDDQIEAGNRDLHVVRFKYLQYLLYISLEYKRSMLTPQLFQTLSRVPDIVLPTHRLRWKIIVLLSCVPQTLLRILSTHAENYSTHHRRDRSRRISSPGNRFAARLCGTGSCAIISQS